MIARIVSIRNPTWHVLPAGTVVSLCGLPGVWTSTTQNLATCQTCIDLQKAAIREANERRRREFVAMVESHGSAPSAPRMPRRIRMRGTLRNGRLSLVGSFAPRAAMAVVNDGEK